MFGENVLKQFLPRLKNAVSRYVGKNIKKRRGVEGQDFTPFRSGKISKVHELPEDCSELAAQRIGGEARVRPKKFVSKIPTFLVAFWA